MKKTLFIILILTGFVSAADEPGVQYKLVHSEAPVNDGRGPDKDIVQEVYQKEDEDSEGPRFKIVLRSWKYNNIKKELLFAFDRSASATIAPDGKTIVVDDRPLLGHCEPRLFKLVSGLKFAEVKDARIRERAINFFIKTNKLGEKIRQTMIEPGDCFVTSFQWSSDSQSLMLRMSKQRTGEVLWLSSRLACDDGALGTTRPTCAVAGSSWRSPQSHGGSIGRTGSMMTGQEIKKEQHWKGDAQQPQQHPADFAFIPLLFESSFHDVSFQRGW